MSRMCRKVEVSWNGKVYACEGVNYAGVHHHNYTRLTPRDPKPGDIDIKTGRPVLEEAR